MSNEKLISELSSYIKTHSLKNAHVESHLGLPKNSLSNFLSGKKELPKKWIAPITGFLITHNKNKSVDDSLGDLKDKVKPASEIPIPIKQVNWQFENEVLDLIDLGKRLNLFCKQNKTDSDSLFSWLMDNYKKKEKRNLGRYEAAKPNIQDFTKENAVGKPYNPFNNPLFKSKMDKTRKVT